MKLSKKEKDRLKSKYGPWAIVTGASSGIGKEMASQLASCGLNLILVGRNLEGLENQQKELEGYFKIEVKVIRKDLGIRTEIEELKVELSEFEIGLAILSAGFGTSGLFKNSELQSELNMLDVNCYALLSLTHFFAKAFVKKNRGGLVLLSSIVAFQGVPYSANYAATKAYVQSLGEGLAQELKADRVDVLTVAPGPVETNFAGRANLEMSSALNVEDVAIPSLKALGRKSHINPGLLTKALKGSLNTAPRFLKVKIMGMVMKGMAIQSDS